MANEIKRPAKGAAILATPAPVAKARPKAPVAATPVAAMMTAAPPVPVETPAAAPIIVATPVEPVAPPVPAAVAPLSIAQPPAAVAPPAPAAVAAPAPVAPPAPVVTPAVAPVPPVVAAAPAPASVTPPQPPKEIKMNETMTDMSNHAAETIKTGTETAYANGKAALDQVTTKSKEAIEHGMKSLDEMTSMARGNVEALLASTRAATTGLESIAHQVADFSRKHFEETTAAARAMTTVKTPNELMQLQNDFAKTQFDAAISEMSKLSETLVKLAGEVFEPMQNRVALATDKMKSAAATTFKM